MPGFLQPAVPEFFEWLNARLSSVRVLNVECRTVLKDPGCRWVWPARAKLAPPPPTHGTAALCAVRLVAGCPQIKAQSWLSNVAVYYQNLTALCLRVYVLVLPVMPQLQVLVYGYRSVGLSPDLLESVACQPRLLSLQLLGQWSDTIQPGCIKRLQDMTHLAFVRFDCFSLKDLSFTEHVALPEALAGGERCSATLRVVDPNFSTWSLRTFPFLTSLCIEWQKCHRTRAQPAYVFKSLPNTVERVDLKYPVGLQINSPLKLPQAQGAAAAC